MNVLVLMPLAEQRGGAERLLLELLRYGRGGGVTWTVAFFEEGPLREAVADLGVQTYAVPTGRLREGRRYARSVRRLRQLVEAEAADLVFSWMAKAHLYGGVAAWRAGVPAAWYQHGMPEAVGWRAGWMDRLVTLVPARGVVACSQAVAEAQRCHLWPRRRVQVARPCVNLEQFDPEALPPPSAARRQLGLPTGVPLIGLVGRLQRWKGQHVLVEALPEVLCAHPDARVVLVGGAHDLEPDYPRVLRERIAALEVEERVIRAGYQEDVPRWMQAMDVVVHASDREPFGMVIIEAMALGKPVVAGKQGGPAEIIEAGENGLLAPFGDAGALAKRIRRYLDDPDFARRMGRNARRRAQDFAPTRYAARLTRGLRVLAGHTASQKERAKRAREARQTLAR